MHELSITQSVVDAVIEKTSDAQVRVVHLTIGRLSGVVTDSIRFCFDVVTEGTPLEGAVLDIREPGGRARCRTCGAEYDVADLVLLCPCGSVDVALVSGRELLVESVEIAV